MIAAIGAGGMGEVYRARDTRLDREVAIKVLPADRLTDEHRRLRFVQEARSASALNHPHIVTIHEIESHGDIDFIVMEYVRGRSLDAIIPRQGLRLNELLRIGIAVADALAAAHARGIVHRDLKPANVMIGDEGAVKVLDFGLAKLMRGDSMADEETTTQAAGPGLSAPGAIVGTAAYMAPELCAVEPNVPFSAGGPEGPPYDLTLAPGRHGYTGRSIWLWLPGPGSARTRSCRPSAPAAWARSTRHATRASIAPSPSS